MSEVLSFNAALIANKNSWQTKDLSQVLASLEDELSADRKQPSSAGVRSAPSEKPVISLEARREKAAEATVRLALPDGHQQRARQLERTLGTDGRARAVADYIAGMTDRFAIVEHQKLFNPSELT